MGHFEELMKDIEAEVADAEGGWFMNRLGELTIHQRVSRDPSRSRSGGEYDYHRRYCADGLGVEVYETWSCEVADRSQYGGADLLFDCIVTSEGLERMAKLADVTVAAKAWLAKEPGCMKRLKSAIRALAD